MADTTVEEATWAALVDALGLPADAEPETVLAAVEEIVATPPPTPEQVAAAAGVDETALAQLRRDAEQGRVLAAAARKREVADKVDAAVNRGAIMPSRRVHWMAVLEADGQMADTLASLPDQLAVPLTEVGHGVDTDATDVVETASWFY